MLDLSKPMGMIEGLTTYGDHARNDLFYVLPDEIGLLGAPGATDLLLQVFFEDAALIGSGDLADSVGGILAFGIGCGIAPERLAEAERLLKARLQRDAITLSLPPWEGGTVDFMLLDTRSGASALPARDDDALVLGTVASRAPSLETGDLAARFHARLDRRGTALLAAALDGAAGSVAGVQYDLEFLAMRPAIDLRMRADLDRVAESFSFGAGVSYYVGVDIQATFAELKEEGVIEVELVTEVADADTQKQIDEAVQDFYDTLMRELFRPSVPPLQELAGAAGSAMPSLDTSIVSFNFSYTKTEATRVIEVDYRKRMARRRHHTPQGHLALLTDGAGAGSFTQRVPLSTAWRNMSVEASAPRAFEDQDLRGISVVMWRGRDAVLPASDAPDGLRMPASVSNLARFDFNADDAAPRRLQFVFMPDEPPFYWWQIKLTYGVNDAVDSPLVLWSEPRRSTSVDLDVFPDTLVSERRIRLELGGGHGNDLDAVEAELVARLADGTVAASRRLRVTQADQDAAWTVRRSESMSLDIEARLRFIYRDGRILLEPQRRLVEPDLLANTPLAGKVPVSVIVVGGSDLLMITIDLSYEDAESGYLDRRALRLMPPDFAQAVFDMPVRRRGDAVAWTATGIQATGGTTPLGKGSTTGDPVVLNLAVGRQIRVEWVGLPLADEDLRFVHVTVEGRDAAGQIVDSQTIEWQRGVPAEPRTISMARDLAVRWRSELRFVDGERRQGTFEPLVGNLIVVSP